MKLNPYLNFGGNCAEALRFYEKHLGAKIVYVMHFDEIPGGNPHAGADKLIVHANMTLGETSVMVSDVPNGRWEPMRSAYLTLTVDSAEEAEKKHAVLSEGGEIFMKMEETFYAYRFSMLRDKFGINWMIIYPKPMQ